MTGLAQFGLARRAVAFLCCAWLLGAGCASVRQPYSEGDEPAAADTATKPVGGGNQHTATAGSRAPDPNTEQLPQPPARVSFTPRLEGDVILVDVTSPIPLFRLSCSNAVVLQRREGDAWVAPRDERPPSYQNPGYYLDGAFVPRAFNLGCDAVGCFSLSVSDPIYVGPAREYVRTGSKAPPEDRVPASGPPAVPAQVDVFESRPLSGRVLITIKYFEDSSCGEESSAALEFTIPTPDQGVCCPIGTAGCSSAGPGGGWAPTLDACRPWTVVYDAMVVPRDDARSCPALALDDDICCGCVPGDAGV